MIFILQGDDALLKQANLKNLYKKYKEDDFNYIEFRQNIELADLTTAMSQVPMIADYYTVTIFLNKKQFIRLKQYLKPSKFTVLILVLEDFLLTEDLKSGLEEFQLIDCSMPKGKALIKWISDVATSYNVDLDSQDKKVLSQMFDSLNEIKGTIYMMSFLDDFDRHKYLSSLVNVRQRFVWDLFVSLATNKRRDFFAKYAEQYKQNLGVTPSQFNMKTIGGIIYCLNRISDPPSWIEDKLEKFKEDIDFNVPKLYVELVKIQALSRFENNSVKVLEAFVKLFDSYK